MLLPFFPPRAVRASSVAQVVFSAPGRFEKKKLPLLCSWCGSLRFRSYAHPGHVVLPMAPRPCRQHGQPHELCGCGLPSLVPHGGQLENCRSRQYCLCHPPLITCMRQAREQNSGVVRATDEPAEQQMQQRWERSAPALTMSRGSEASFAFVGTHRDIVSSRILHRSLLLCRSPLIICV